MQPFEVLDIPPCKWGEGAIWHDNSLFFVDIEGHLVQRWTPTTGTSGKLQQWNVGERVGFVVPQKDSTKLLIGTDSGLYTLNPETGATTLLANPEPNSPNNRFNDGKCSPDGRLFAGTISLVKETGSASLWRLDSDLSVHLAYPSVTTSNGIVWSSDGSTCWYIDTPKREILAFDYTPATGLLTNPRQAVNTGHIDASPDGMAIDENNHLWVAFCHGGCVVCFDPGTGKQINRIDFPALETTSCAFGGENQTDLYITTGIHKSIQEELGGHTFRIANIGVKGAKTHSFVQK